jgi:hypothetical protein
MTGAPMVCDVCGADLTGDDDADYFGEPAYQIRLLSPGQEHRGRRYLVTCPTPCRTEIGLSEGLR